VGGRMVRRAPLAPRAMRGRATFFRRQALRSAKLPLYIADLADLADVRSPKLHNAPTSAATSARYFADLKSVFFPSLEPIVCPPEVRSARSAKEPRKLADLTSTRSAKYFADLTADLALVRPPNPAAPRHTPSSRTAGRNGRRPPSWHAPQCASRSRAVADPRAQVVAALPGKSLNRAPTTCPRGAAVGDDGRAVGGDGHPRSYVVRAIGRRVGHEARRDAPRRSARRPRGGGRRRVLRGWCAWTWNAPAGIEVTFTG